MWENLSQYENLMKFNLAGEQVLVPWVFFIFLCTLHPVLLHVNCMIIAQTHDKNFWCEYMGGVLAVSMQF